MKLFLSVINAICALIVIFCTAVEIPTFSTKFYVSEYEKYSIHSSIDVSISDLTRVTVKLQDYMKDKEDNLNISVIAGGEYREFFNTKEKQHMVDVKYLFTIGFYVRNISVILFLLTGVLMYIYKARLKTTARIYLTVFCSFILLIGLLACAAVVDFDAAFNIFHRIFFTNELWLLDPSTDLLINIMPIEFFIDISKYIAGLFFGVCSAIIVCSLMVVRYRHRS